jgi:predicted O-linked N-acetylglucosamine transferase (SPINDLY family)
MTDLSHKMKQLHELLASGKGAQVILEVRKMLAKDPGDPWLCNAMASALVTQGHFQQAVFYSQTGLKRAGDDAFLLRNFGAILSASGRKDLAREPLRRAMDLEPSDPGSIVAAARITWETGGTSEAMAMLDRARAIAPKDFKVASLTAEILASTGRAREALDLARRLIAAAPGHLNLAAMAANTANYVDGIDPSEVLSLHRRFGSLVEQNARAELGRPITPARTDPDPNRRLRIGLLSFDLNVHSVGFYVEAILRHLDRTRFDLTIFATGGSDARTEILKAFPGAWREVGTFPDAIVAERIRAERIDVLLETSGLTMGHRLGVLAMCPAPVQVTCIGYPNTTGMRSIQHRLVDRITDPVDADLWHVERLERLEECFLCYTPPQDAPDPNARPSDATIVFGSFNAAKKISEGLPALWSRVLNAVPGSRLVLKSREFRDPVMGDLVRERFAAAGIAPDRVEMLPSQDTQREHLARYHAIDIALDTYPYHGTTTTCEALWMGVPVVTLRGAVHASRVGASLLHAAGLDDWVAATPDEYVAIATRAASDRAALASLRASLRSRVAASTLCDGPAYARRLGDALERMWRAWCAGVPS